MNYRAVMEKSTEYIEVNIKEHLTTEKIAKYVGYSLYHFGRIFRAFYGLSVMEYVLKRRLSLAVYDMSHGVKMIDVASIYGFETASGFSKAFRRHYNCSPTQYLQNCKNDPENTFLNEVGVSKEILEQNVRFETRESFKIIGFSMGHAPTDVNSTAEMAATWHGVADHDELEIYLYKTLKPTTYGEVGVFVTDEKGDAHYVMGLIMKSFEKAEAGMLCLEIPEATYAVFTTLPFDELANPGMYASHIRKTWKGIFENWLSESEYAYDFDKLDFEFYDQRTHSAIEAVMEIWVPIKRKDALATNGN